MRMSRWWLLLLIALVSGACSTAAETSADDPGEATPTTEQAVPASPPDSDDDQTDPEPDTDSDGREAPGGGQGQDRDVPPLVLPAQAPGSDEAYQQLMADLDRFLTAEQRAEGVPWPDLRNPDPVAVYRSCAEFQNWMSRNNPTPTLVEGYTAPNSPERGFDLDLFEFRNSLGLLATPAVPPYSMRVAGVVHPAATDITNGLLALVPEGSVAVVYWDSVGRSDLVDEFGNVFTTDEGWTDLGPWVAIMAPTDVGWQVWWDELTDIPPPGLNDDRDTPGDEPPRQQV